MNLGVQGFSQLSGRAGKIDYHAVRVLHIDLETMRPQPVLNGVAILLSYTKPLAELLRRKPAVKAGRGLVVKVINKLVEFLLLLRRAFQQKLQVLH